MGKRIFLFVLALGVAPDFARGGSGSWSRGAEPPPLVKPIPPVSGQGDPLAAQQWHLGALNLAHAWKVTKGTRSTTLAFVDSGVDYTHPELLPNLRWNDREWPPNGRDKCGNGFIDDVIGFDFTRNHYLPFDGSGHGTFLSGLAAAVEGNGIGISGVCPGCSLLPLKFINSDGFGDTEDAIHGIDYAVMMQASVINVSFSGEGYDKHLHESLNAAGEHDIVVVAAASNDGVDLDKADIYPAKYDLPNMLTVAASAPDGRLWQYSNWGRKTVHVAAPGQDVLSIWREHKDGYDTGSGTSDAAAIVSGVVGLVRSANPKLAAVDVVRILQKTVRRVAALDDRIRSGGVVDAAAAIRCAVDPELFCLKQ